MRRTNLTAIDGFEIGHAQDLQGGTGCSTVIAPEGAVAGVDVRGGAPGTRETDLLNPVNLVDKIHAVFLSGGSAFGLDCATGIMQFLEDKEIGFDVAVAKVPIVSGAVLFDLPFGDPQCRPDAAMGYAAAKNAFARKKFGEGNVGAGTGATVGKIVGMERAMKGGLGACCFQEGELQVGALVAVNCLGDVVDPESGKILAGALKKNGRSFLDTEKWMISQQAKSVDVFSGNTTIGVVMTNAKMTKAQANKLASMAQNGFARAMRPAHSMYDGDTIFAMSTNKVQADFNVVGLLAARATAEAVVRGVTQAKSHLGIKSRSDT
jgi:L-aminopeptidase/D-esterase-like protein